MFPGGQPDMARLLEQAQQMQQQLAAAQEQLAQEEVTGTAGGGLVSRSRDAQRRPVHLEAEVLDLMTKWIERYRQQAEERYRRLDDVLAAMPDDTSDTPTTPQGGHPS